MTDPNAAPDASAPASQGDSYDGKTVEFMAPDGFHYPDGVQPGDEFNAVGTFRLQADGNTMCLVDIEGNPVHPLPKSQQDSGAGEDDNTPFVDRIERGMTSTSQ